MRAPVTHASFTVERTFPVPPARVFAAFADPELKAKWFHGPEGWTEIQRDFDFREGGHEITAGEVPGEWSSRFDARFHVVEQDALIVYTYVMSHNDVRLSVSLATFELEPVDGGAATRLVVTEQGAYFVDGIGAKESREEGTKGLLEQLAEVL